MILVALRSLAFAQSYNPEIMYRGALAAFSSGEPVFRAVAETGVDVISVGALTHSARSLDVSLEVLA